LVENLNSLKVIPFLGMRIAKDASGAIFVDQPHYVDELVADMWEETTHSSPSHRALALEKINVKSY
jgi:hypothetical protein